MSDGEVGSPVATTVFAEEAVESVSDATCDGLAPGTQDGDGLVSTELAIFAPSSAITSLSFAFAGAEADAASHSVAPLTIFCEEHVSNSILSPATMSGVTDTAADDGEAEFIAV
jgi:hypothetical protein